MTGKKLKRGRMIVEWILLMLEIPNFTLLFISYVTN